MEPLNAVTDKTKQLCAVRSTSYNGIYKTLLLPTMSNDESYQTDNACDKFYLWS